MRPSGSYISPRPIRINTADIDVSASKFRRNRNARVRSTSPEVTKTENENSNTNDISAFMPRIDQNDPIQSRATIKRDRNIVRLSTMRQISRTHSNRSSAERSIKRKSNNSVDSNTSSKSIGIIKSDSFKRDDNKSLCDDEKNDDSDSSLNVKKSWRDRFGDSLHTNTQKVVRKTPGELILERYMIPDETAKNTLKTPRENALSTTVRIPDNVTPQEITYLEPLIRKSIRRQSLISCPNFKDICKDISSDITAEDDLNAGDLRRRASLILEQESQILAQLTTINRRPSADVIVDESIIEESASNLKEDDDENSNQIIQTEKIDEGAAEQSSNVENVIVIKRKTKKKGGKIKHKITVTVEVENPKVLPIKKDANQIAKENEEIKIESKSSPTWRAVVEEIEEDVILNLPKKDEKDTFALQKIENEQQDFWNLIGRSETTCFKRKVDLKRNEIEIIEIIGSDGNKTKELKSEISKHNDGIYENESKLNDEKAPSKTKIKSSAEEKKEQTIKLNNSETNSNEKKTDVIDNSNAKMKPKPIIIKDQTKEIINMNNIKEKSKIIKEIVPNVVECSSEKTTNICISNEKIDEAKGKNDEKTSSCHEYKQIEKLNVKAATMMQTTKSKIDIGPIANKTELESTKQKQKQKPIISATSEENTLPAIKHTKKTDTNENDEILKISNDKSSPINDFIDNNDDMNNNNIDENKTNDKQKPKKIVKKTAAKSTSKSKKNDEQLKIDANATKIKKNNRKLKSKTTLNLSAESEMNDETKKLNADKLTALHIDTNLSSDRGNDNESNELIARATLNNKQINANESNSRIENDKCITSISKFPTIANLNTDLSCFEQNQQQQLNQFKQSSTFSCRSIADSCISGDESFEFLLDSLNDSDNFDTSASDREEEDDNDNNNKDMAIKKRRRRRGDKNTAHMKLDPKRKCYVVEESSKYPLIATPRPLAKRSNYCGKCVESESDTETNSDICSSDECYDECLSPNDVVVKDVIRMSTCSNDSGFEGGGTAPSSPKKMLGKRSLSL